LFKGLQGWLARCRPGAAAVSRFTTGALAALLFLRSLVTPLRWLEAFQGFLGFCRAGSLWCARANGLATHATDGYLIYRWACWQRRRRRGKRVFLCHGGGGSKTRLEKKQRSVRTGGETARKVIDPS